MLHDLLNWNQTELKKQSPETSEASGAAAEKCFKDSYCSQQPADAGKGDGSQVRSISFHPIAGYDSRSPDLVAESYAGQQLWKDRRYRAVSQDGHVGCAGSESVVLQHAGYPYADSAGVAKLYGQLKAHGWKPVDPADKQPNDVMFAYVGGKNWAAGGNAHVGTVAQDGEIWNNSSRQGETWAKEPASVAFGDYDRYLVLRPPAKR